MASTGFSPAGSLFSSNGLNSDALGSRATRASSDLLGTGSKLTSGGEASLAPLLQTLMKLVGGDSAAVDEAIAPQKRTVLSQYDTGRKAIAERTPRGGGQASSINESYAKEAGDLGTLRSEARTSGIQQLLSAAGIQFNAGANASSTGLQGLMSLMQQAVQEKGQNTALLGDIGKGIGDLIGGYLAGGLA